MDLRGPLALVTIELIAKCEENVSPSDLVPGRLAYPEFIAFMGSQESIDRHRFIIATHMVYGWMPRMLELRETGLEEAVEMVNRVRTGSLLSIAELAKLKEIMNNSISGMSKLLHFLNPRNYAICDSSVQRFVETVAGTRWDSNRPDAYGAYTERCRELVSDRAFPAVRESIARKLDYPGMSVSPLRSLELVMWVSGRKRRRQPQDPELER